MPVALADIAPTRIRLCPKCGATTQAGICPADTTATVDLQAFETANWQLKPGQIVAGKYRVTSEIARGGHGTVYRAEHLLGLGTVALKLPGRETMDVVDLRRFFREAQVSARLTGAHTARVFDVGQTDEGALYLAMEFVDGPTLETVLRHLHNENKVTTESEATRIALDVLDGLTEAHGCGLVHRDLKPSNIAIRRADGAVKILDFGLALVHDSSLTPNERAMGTPHYMSPEQCQGGEVDARADLYALGVILYRMLAGKLPFVGDGTMAVLWGHVHRPVPDVASHAQTPVSPALAQVVMRALAKRPDRRFASAAAMREALARAVTGPADVVAADWANYPDVHVTESEGDATASASGVDRASVPGPAYKSRFVAGWALLGATAAIFALATRAERHSPTSGPEEVGTLSTAVATVMPAAAGVRGTVAPSVPAPQAATPTVQATAETHAPVRETERPRPVHHRTAGRGAGHEGALRPDWKKPLLPQ